MFGTIASISALLLSVSLLLAGSGLQGTLLPIRAHMEAFSTLDIGILGSAYYFGFAAGCLLTPRVVRLVGHIRAFSAMACIASSVALGHAMILSPVVWWMLRAMTGFCFAAIFMVIESWLNERSTNQNRGAVFSIYTVISLTVVTIGQLMIMLYDPDSFSLFCIAAILISLAAVPVALTTARAPAPIKAVKIRLLRLYRASPVGFAGCLVVGLANGSFWALAPVYAQQSGMGISGVAIFMSLSVIAGAVGQAALGLTSDRMDRRGVIAFACTAASLAGVATALLSRFWSPGIYFSVLLFGAFALPLYSLCVAHTNDLVPPDAYVEVSSGLLLTFAIGAILGPVFASAAMGAVGKEALFGFSAAGHAAMAAFAWYKIRTDAPAPDGDREVFRRSILCAQTVGPLDPGRRTRNPADIEAAQQADPRCP